MYNASLRQQVLLTEFLKISEMHDKSCATIQGFADHGEARNLK
jgi:hypothetical protein